MKFDGITVQKVKTLGWRYANPEKDRDLSGNPLLKRDMVIVRIKDCRIYTENGRNYYDPEDAPAIPMTLTGSHYGYGKTRVRTSRIIDTDGTVYNRYFTTPFYVVYDGYVYRGYVRRIDPSIGYFLQHGYTYKMACALVTQYKEAMKLGIYMEVELP